tara:strand:- start:418 stop:546 length:129 start_codon:yes stop_codon:yes gene_type:complete
MKGLNSVLAAEVSKDQDTTKSGRYSKNYKRETNIYLKMIGVL